MAAALPDDMPADMWRIYRDEDGVKEALAKYWPRKVAANPALRHALRQIELAEVAIDAIMNAEES